MKVLVIDTALDACTAAVFDGDRPPAVRQEIMARGHQERLAVLARDAVAEAGGFDGLARIGVTVGPGSFTGLRVGLAFAQGLGAALGLPVVGLSTLDALAASVPAEDVRGPVAALIDARRGQVYARFWRDGAGLGPPEPLAVAAAAERIAALTAEGGEVVLVGGGAPVVRAALDDATAARLSIRPETTPTAAALARLTIAADPASNPPRPLYLRSPDATPPSRAPGQPRA